MQGSFRRTGAAAAVSAACLLAALGAAAPARAGAVLDRVKASGTLHCGVVDQPDDWGKADVHASLPEFNTDMCRALAAAVLGAPDKAAIVAVPSEQRGFRDLGTGRIDVLMGATPSTSAAIAFGATFARPMFLDGDALLVHRDAGIRGFADLAGRTVCYAPGTEAEDALVAEAARRRIAYTPWPFEENGEMLGAVVGRKCDALFGSASRLAEDRTNFHARTKDFVLLPERYSVLPLAPAVAVGDAAWSEVVDSVVALPLQAEAAGVDRAHAAALHNSQDPLLRSFSGTLPGIDAGLVDAGWATRALGAAGNAAEIFDRDLGEGSDLKLPRGDNALRGQGGLMVPDTIR